MISILPLIPVSVYIVDESPICISLLAVTWLKVTFDVVSTGCPIDISCVTSLEPLNPTPVFDIVTPVPWLNINEFSTDIENISFVTSPNSAAFDDKSIV